MASLLLKQIWFIFLLPVFFVFNGFRENYPLVPLADSLKLIGVYILFAFVFYSIFLWIYKNKNKAALASFAVLFVHFFFGSLHDFLKNIFGGSFLARYSVLIPVIAGLLLLLFIGLKKKNWRLRRPVYFLNLLFLLLLLSEVIYLVIAVRNKPRPLLAGGFTYTTCPGCPKPDIYLLVADEYAGNETLDTVFNFDNSAFTNELRERNFHILKNSFSNYNSTPFSVASILNMDYLVGISGSHKHRKDVNRCYEAIRNSRVLEFFTASGYQFYNYSIFDSKKSKSPVRETFIPQSTGLFTSQTFLSRVENDLGHHLVTSLGLSSFHKKINLKDQQNNNKLFGLLHKVIKDKKPSPKFVYGHLMMPHYPYYFNSNGQPYDWESLHHFNSDTSRYIQYLQYSNSKFLGIIDSILHYSASPPIIILTGDHGFRQFPKSPSAYSLYNNFSAVLLPQKNYAGFYDSMSMVNHFRVILNAAFSQNFPMLADSTIFIHNKSNH